ncbi:MAG: hypothetical protein KatS3mg029_1020 [Saprospiraceae bacterium]|nr:MAG: hypothetical protein KatS3mg029_1020 [Saprospiraceae bacterium]
MKKILFALSFLFLMTSLHAQDQLTSKQGFTLNPAEEHYYLFVLNDRPGDLPELLGEITKYIWKYHPREHLKITQIAIEGELENTPIVHVRSFPDKAAAMAFHRELLKNHPDFLHMGLTVDYFPISKSNYEQVLRTKSLGGYRQFFDANYQ